MHLISLRHSIHARHALLGVFGPFDGDFDPFEDDEGVDVLIPLD
ncbi:MAG: hypothetical protein NTY87_12645 [Planctomycetia bacterium]|nr:hypothetical protein [Planctomycetia bacterium]